MAPTVEQSFLPIAELSAYQNKWTIKARVTNKSTTRTWSKNGNQGKVFSVDLLDAMGGEIKATFFNQGAEKYESMLEKGKCFTFSRGSTNVANKQYNSTSHRYELKFDKDAIVEIATEDSSIEAIKFSFVNLRALGTRTLPTTVDVCGIITSFQPTQSVTSKDGVELVKRELILADDTATSMKVTIWGDRAKQEDSIFEGLPVVALKAVSVKDWKDSRAGSLLASGDFIIKPSMPETARLEQWWAKGGSTQTLASLSEVTDTGNAGRGRNATATTLGGLRLASERVGNEPELFSVVARLALVQTRKQGEVQPLHYMACQEIRENITAGRAWSSACNKRVDEQGFCAACNRAGKVAPRLNMRCRFVDFEDGAWLTSFHEAATKIIGMSGEELRAMEQAAMEKGEAGREELEGTIRKQYFAKPMNVTIRAKMDNYNGEPRTNVTVIDAKPVSHAEHGRQMLKDIQELLSSQAQAGA